ncbi:permease [candidate division KSB1 bacterium]|nr:permease [candidate division KSB1 bacterium]
MFFDIINEVYFYLLNLFQGTYTLRILESFFELLIDIAPYFFISILIQCLLNRLIHKKSITIKIKSENLSIFAAGILGLLSPMPTYAAVPVGLSFVSLGVPASTVISFIIASPLLNPSVFFLTLTQLGFKIAIARLVAAYMLAVLGGFLFGRFMRSFVIKQEVKLKDQFTPRRSFIKNFYRASVFLGKYFLIALLISASVKALVSPAWISKIMGPYIQKSLIIAIALGIPFYSCGGAAIPIIEVLRDMGMNDGAILAFFIAGPATKIETIYIFKSMLGSKIFIFYLFVTIIGAYFSGLIMYLLF